MCGETKPFDAFYRNRSKPGGITRECRPCFRTFAQRRRERMGDEAFLARNAELVRESRIRNGHAKPPVTVAIQGDGRLGWLFSTDPDTAHEFVGRDIPTGYTQLEAKPAGVSSSVGMSGPGEPSADRPAARTRSAHDDTFACARSHPGASPRSQPSQ